MKVAVIGGGLAGLTAAYDLTSAGIDVTVFEASDRWGGKIHSAPVGDRMVDAGPDNFLARVEDATSLCVELGLGDKLTVPVSPVPTYVYRSGRLHQLPVGTVLGVPTDFEALSRSGLISTEGIQRARQDLSLPTTPLDERTTVARYCRARLGDEVTDVLIDPMVGGINASSIEELSMADGARQLYDAAKRSPSLIAGLRSARATVGPTLGSAAANQPVFHGLAGGMGTLVEGLVGAIENRAELRLGCELSAMPDGFDHVVIATQAHAAARLLGAVNDAAATHIAGIGHASVAQITIEIPIERIDPLDASGILVPRTEGLLMTACTWFSTKWAQYASDNTHLVRMTSGRYRDDRAIDMSDSELTDRLLADFTAVYADPGRPTSVRIVRWPLAFPQYEPGHGERVDATMAALESRTPNLHVIGNSYRGIGIPATIRMAREAAALIVGSGA